MKMEKRVFIITGIPGIGKTSIMLKMVDILEKQHYSIGGMITREVRKSGERIGFEVLDISKQKKGWLARISQTEGPRIGKYCVNIKDLNEIGTRAILQGLAGSDIIAIDEIGPMELFSQEFVQAAVKAIESDKPVVCTVHWRIKHPLVDPIVSREDAETFVVDLQNRDHLPQVLADRIDNLLRNQRSEKGL